MKKLTAVIASIFAFLSLCSAENPAAFTQDDVFASLTSRSVTSGSFVQEKFSAKLKKPLKSSGKFIFCDTGVVWQTLKPFPGTLAVTDSSMIQVKPDGTKTVTDGSSNQVFKSVAATVSSVFSGDRQKLETYFTVEFSILSENSWKILLFPKDSTISASLKSIQLKGTFAAGSASLDSMKILQGEKDYTEYTLTDKVYRQELTDAEKAFFN